MGINISEQTIKNPITFMGKMAAVAYGTDTSDNAKNYKRGLQCVKDGHGRMLEFIDVYFTITGYSNRVIRELARHVGDGLTMIQESTRYVDFSKGFDYIIPPSIVNNTDAHFAYTQSMSNIKATIDDLMNKYNIPKEDAQMLIPLGASTKVVMKKNMRNLMDMSRVRMCNRAYWEFRNLMTELKNELSNISPEWKELCDMLLKPKCNVLGYCTEKFSCGRAKRKEE